MRTNAEGFRHYPPGFDFRFGRARSQDSIPQYRYQMKRQILIAISGILVWLILSVCVGLLVEWTEPAYALSGSQCENTWVIYESYDRKHKLVSRYFNYYYTYQCMRAITMVTAACFGLMAALFQLMAFRQASRWVWKDWCRKHSYACGFSFLAVVIALFEGAENLEEDDYGLRLIARSFVVVLSVNTVFSMMMGLFIFEMRKAKYYVWHEDRL